MCRASTHANGLAGVALGCISHTPGSSKGSSAALMSRQATAEAASQAAAQHDLAACMVHRQTAPSPSPEEVLRRPKDPLQLPSSSLPGASQRKSALGGRSLSVSCFLGFEGSHAVGLHGQCIMQVHGPA